MKAQHIPTQGYRLCLGCDGTGLGPEWREADPAWPYQLCTACGGDGEFQISDATAPDFALRRVPRLEAIR
jgi:hypothetical protein